MSIERGAGWLLDGFGYFSKSPLTWIGVILLFFVIVFVIMLIPLLGSLMFNLVNPVFMAGLMLGCHAQAQGGELTVNHLFAGFSKNTAQLVVLGLLYMLGIILISVIVLILMFTMLGGMSMFENLQAEDPEFIMQNFRAFLLVALIATALYLPLLMAYWFAPVLIVLSDVSPLEALKLSFMACLVNILPFTLYGIVGLVLTILAAIPLGLGFLILMPMVIASIYIAWREIFST